MVGQARHLADLDFVELMVAAQQQHPVFQDRLAVDFLFHRQRDRLDGLAQVQLEHGGHRFALGGARGGGLGQRRAGRRARGSQRQRFGRFHIGCVVGRRAVHDGVFAGAGDDVEFMRAGAADGAVVGCHGAELEAETVENGGIRVKHDLVRRFQARFVAVERVRVLHREFAPAHQAETGTALVAELGLDMVKIERQLAVRLDFRAHHVGDDFLGGGLDREFAAVAVFHAHQFWAHLVPAARLLPQFGRLDQRHQQLDAVRLVHFLTDNGFDLADHAQTGWHIGINARTEALDHAGAHHQLMADDFRVGRRIFIS